MQCLTQSKETVWFNKIFEQVVAGAINKWRA
jgi:hypothetical protein